MRWVAPPDDLRPWTDGGVVVQAPATLPASCFPAMVGSMLVLRLAGAVHRAGVGPVPAAALIGPATRPSRYLHQGAVHAVGLLIRPEALPVLLGAPGGRLVNAQVAWADVAGAGWSALQAAVQMAVQVAPDDDARLALLFDGLRAAVAGPAAAQHGALLQRLVHALQGPLALACRDLAISRRQLERLCRAQFGMAPKQVQTINRLQQALHGAAHTGGADLALQAGYYDQSHLARDLRRLAGEPLGALVQQARQGDSSAHWPLAVGWQLSG
jgi:AraC-like DNA-binding protein